MSAVSTPPATCAVNSSDAAELSEAVFTLRKRAKTCERLAELHYRAGQFGLALDRVEEARWRESICLGAVHQAAMDGTLKHVGFHSLGNDKWVELLSCGDYTLHQPCPPPAAGESRINDDFDCDAFPDKLVAMRLTAASEIVIRRLLGIDVEKMFFWPDESGDRDWINDLYEGAC